MKGWNNLTPDQKRQLEAEAGELIKSEILNKLSSGITPVSNGEYKRSLSKEYRQKKTAQGGASFSDMKLEGDMLGSLEYRTSPGEITVGIWGDEAPKAHGHNKGTAILPRRQFIPDTNETFKRDIMNKVQSLIRDKNGER